MRELSTQSLDQAVRLCYENDRYRVLVVTRYMHDHPDILDYLSKYNLNNIKSNGNCHIVFFPNSSHIKIIGTSENQCGIRADLVLYDWRLANDKDVMLILKCFEAKNTYFKLSTRLEEV
jgi:hypothetical protein